MRPSKIKDKILKTLIECKISDSGKIAEHLNVPHSTVYTLVIEMANANHVKLLDITTIDYYYGYSISLLPQGEYFYNSTSYRRQALKKWWIDAPKNFWIIGAILALLSTNAALILSLVSKGKFETQQGIPQKSNAVKQDTLLHK